MKKLFIAEKPDIGRALAAHLWADGKYKKEQGYFYSGDTGVTWAFGHILGLAVPEAYGEEYKSWSKYPVIPKDWRLVPAPSSAKQLDVIKELLTETETVIHAGDPDREGQLLIDEILRYLNFTGNVKRILINAKDDESMRRAFKNIEDNGKYENLYYAGLGRERADWLVGMNLSRLYTVAARKSGHENVFRVGRVKVPTLALVVQREKEIKSFKSQKYYELTGHFEKNGVSFAAKLSPSEKLPADSEGRITDKNIVSAVKLKLGAGKVIVKDISTNDASENPPLPHSLDTLQAEANRKYGISPKDVLDTAQELYEKKYVSYPRSDCNYIPSSQQDDAKRILTALSEFGIVGADSADISITGRAFNDKKITAHHAIIPTGMLPRDLTEAQIKIFGLIAARYIVQFYPPCKYQKTVFTLQAADEIFTGSGITVKDMGFRRIEKADISDGSEENSKLPPLSIGDEVSSGGYAVNERKTTPPKRFTEGTLLSAMANIWRFVSPDNPSRDKLKEVKGIGTPATRDTIISELQAASVKGKPMQPCMKKVKNELVPTDFGISLIENVHPSLTVPDLTAAMEYSLSEIAEGKKSLSAYMDEVSNMIYQNIKFAENRVFPPPSGKERIDCPVCKTGELVRHYSQKLKKSFFLCSNEDCVSPETKRRIFYEEKNGKPVIAKCTKCGAILVRILGKNGPFWLCGKCKKTYGEKNGEPDFSSGKGKK